MLKKILSSICLSFLILSPMSLFTEAQKPPTQEKNEKAPVEVNLLSEGKSLQPGQPFWVGVEVKLEKGWDTYWINPGDSGFPINVKWNLPEGYSVGPLHWPYPERFTSQSLVGFGYTHSIILLAEITPPKDLSLNKDATIAAQVNWLACKEQCVPGNASIQLNLPVKATSPEKDDTVAAQFLKARQEIPQSEGEFSLKEHKEAIVLNFKKLGDNIGDVLFVPETPEVIDYSAPQVLKKENDGYVLNLKRIENKKSIDGNLKGVLIISDKGSDAKRAIQVDTANMVASHDQPSYRFAITLLCAFLGGLILNVMPCVLPVISLKIFSFIKMAEQKRSEIFKQGMQFTAGVLISFWALSALLLLLRASGESIGWGFQLQEPTFVITLILILFLLGLSLFGLFELGTSLMSVGNKVGSSNSSFFKGSFMNGVLATLVATPCTGPLLGPALGLAMTLPPFSSLLIFTMMALGMAFPYLIISAFPKLIRFLPKPGQWMIVFKQLMGFLMMGTCAWLIWVFAGQTDHLALLILLITLLIYSVGAWIYGKWGNILVSKKKRYLAISISLLMILGGGTLSLKSVHNHRQIAGSVSQGHDWETYSAEKVNSYREQGKAVFVDFTAKWCLICQANKITLHSAELQKAFHEKNVVVMEADWTMKDAQISEQLHKLGRSGVPVYVLYPADMHQQPQILPQTLTKSIVHDYLSKLDTTTVKAD